MSPYSIHPDTTVGPVSLTVSDLKRSEEFYRQVLGFKPVPRGSDALSLTIDGQTPLLELKENPWALPRPPHTTGLYHFAVLVPSRLDLARSLRRLADVRYPIQGGTDHLVSEALYLADPDGNGIEIYRDRPRDTWTFPVNGEVHMESDPLDYDSILAELDGHDEAWNGLAAGTRMGHVHLNVADIETAEEFYHGVLGFDVTMRRAPGALFISAGGYHHHLGLNIWDGAGAPPPPPDAVGLRHFSIVLPNVEEFQTVAGRVQEAGIAAEEMDEGIMLRDPSQNGVLLTHRTM
jgi:catechol 2,3-dioxygenase